MQNISHFLSEKTLTPKKVFYLSVVSDVKASKQLSQRQPKDVLFPHLHHLPENKGRQGWIYQVHASGFPPITPLRLHVARDLR